MTWQEINNKRLPYIRMGERLFLSMFTEIRKRLIASFNGLQTPEEIIEAAGNVVIGEEEVRTIYEKFYLKTAIDFARWTAKGSRKPRESKQDLNNEILEDMWAKQIIELVGADIGVNITSVTRTAYNDIQNIARKAVEEGLEKGWGMDKIARAIQRSQKEMDLWKAMRIARTEVGTASNYGVNIGADSMSGSKEKVWISTFDQRSRPDHMAMDGVRVPYNENFTLPSGNTLQYPCDPAGAAEDIINCRCGWEVIPIVEIY